MGGCGHVPRPGVCGGCRVTLSLEDGASPTEAGLLACPFCGYAELENLDAAAYGGAVHCIRCGARGPTEFDKLEPTGDCEVSDGLEAWNVRSL